MLHTREQSKKILHDAIEEAKQLKLRPTAEEKSGLYHRSPVADLAHKLVDASKETDEIKVLYHELVDRLVGEVSKPAVTPSTGQATGSGEKPIVWANGFSNGMVVVPLTNPNEHDYELEEPVLVVDEDESLALKSDGTLGNHLPHDDDATRFATSEEIDRFYDSLLHNTGEASVLAILN